ncbi:beta-galactosidase [Rouxiella sp. S1S-2]|uniref:beta-galactosidase n=1 Tax=Rouxiella sp. S1S-2 TaxID=2653856 RepID=UPI001264BC4D|nr:beta-galactosidase [Rouxiella sp. S1S-2]KAB7895313.1 beta-galactosidase [Rouxiella sp. S1S-2]
MSTIYYGVAYYDEYMPQERLAADIAMMKEAGINIVRIAESTWSTLEPQEGEYNFYHIDRVLNAMYEAEIAVIIGTPTYAIPSWLARKHPEVMVTTVKGQEKYGRRQIMDIVSPIFLRYAENIIRVLLEHVHTHPAIVGYQLDNETKHYDNVGPVMQQKFVESLRQRYPNIDQLNKDFGLDYWSNRMDNWEDFPPAASTINASLGCAFSTFQRQTVTDYLAWQSRIVGEYSRPDQFITHNFDFEWRGYSYGVQPRVNHFAAARALTVAGVDIYHPSQAQLTGREISFGGDITRALKQGAGYLVLETEAQGFAQWTPFPGQLRLQAFSHIASGAKMVSYWHWHSIHNSFETYWKGLLSHDFSPNPTYLEAKTIGADLARLSAELDGLKIENDVAILISNEAMDAVNWFKPGDTKSNVYNDVFRRFYDALYDSNISVDIINDVDAGCSRYRVIVVPALYAADDALLKRINHYVEAGGQVLIGFKSGFSDENVKVRTCRQPGILSECCRVSYSQFALPQDTGLNSHSPDVVIGAEDCAELWMELLTPDESEEVRVLASYQHPVWGKYAAITESRYGKGSAIYMGCLSSKKVISQLVLRFADKKPLASCNSAHSFPVIVKKAIGKNGKRLTFYFNYSSDIQPIQQPEGAVCLLGDHDVLSSHRGEIEPWGLRVYQSDV